MCVIVGDINSLFTLSVRFFQNKNIAIFLMTDGIIDLVGTELLFRTKMYGIRKGVNQIHCL